MWFWLYAASAGAKIRTRVPHDPSLPEDERAIDPNDEVRDLMSSTRMKVPEALQAVALEEEPPPVT